MANRKAVLVWLCKTEKGWRRFPALFGANGRPRPGVVRVGGAERKYLDGRFQVRTYEGSRMIYRDAGETASEAMTNRTKSEHLLAARNAAKIAGAKVEAEDEADRKSLSKALKDCVQAALDRGSPESAEVIDRAGRDFLRITGKTYADEVTKEDLLKFQRELRREGKSDRTIHNRHAAVVAYLSFAGLNVKALAPHRPRYEKKLPEVYKPEQVRSLLDHLRKTKRKKLANTYELLLKAGLRDQEATYLYWSNLDLVRGILEVRSKPEYDFKIKDSEERDIPIPSDLLKRLRAYRAAHPHEKLVTGTASDKPNEKLLRALKRAVNAAGLACGQCQGCKRENEPECERWFLHKFRATCLTRLLQAGMDLRTVMKFSGHSDLESVMRYLTPAEDDQIKAKLEQVQFM